MIRTRLTFVCLLTLASPLAGCDDDGSEAEVADAASVVDPDAATPGPDAFVPPTDEVGESCNEGTDCPSGYCVLVGEDERVCTRRCAGDPDCPDDWVCRQVTNAGADVTFICVPIEAPCGGADLQTDPRHCGVCDNVCAVPNAVPTCADGGCVLGDCLDGFHDLDGDASNGCEYACTLTRGGDEACDEIDNDCDGGTDEGFDLETDPAHCGGCNTVCRPANAEGACTDGACGIGACLDGFADADGDASNGCEAGCNITNDGEEACDRIDNDCDGEADEGFDLASDPAHCGACNTSCARANADAACEAGRCALVGCRDGFFDENGDPDDGCEIGCGVTFDGVERCDDIDNDCDGTVDEGVDTSMDPANCGDCGARCARPNALTMCAEGVCRVVGCSDGFFDRNADPADGCEEACRPTFEGVERCDLIDNDCDGAVDEGGDVLEDPEHCGACDRRCAPDDAVGVCVDGLCEIGQCRAGFVDADRDPENGCEVACQVTFGGVERCDELDNDCDGALDEGVDLSGPSNCGACGRICEVPNAEAGCEAGTCVLARCLQGFHDIDEDADNGCEYACTITRDGVEACDEIDNDCDGAVDEGTDTDTDADHCGGCGLACQPPNAVGACVGGDCRVGACVGDFEDRDGAIENGCEFGCTPTTGGAEACDRIDNDCDDAVDEGFDLAVDMEHCGGCNRGCVLANATSRCADGDCGLVACNEGFVDVDGDPSNGCEYGCRITNGGRERCDEVDNDCDGRVDEGFDLQNDAANCTACGATCARPGGFVACVDGGCVLVDCRPGRFDRNGDPDDGCEVRCDQTNGGVEACDGSDNDCDGLIDEGFDLTADPVNCGACGASCERANAVTVCLGGRCGITDCEDGFVDLDGRVGTGCEYACVLGMDGVEACNGADDDCDGRTDEDFAVDRDVDNCGACGRVCAAQRAVPLCDDGDCLVESCDAGWVDVDGAPGNGCECRIRSNGVEACDSVDQDCDGEVDEGFDLQNDPENCGGCGAACMLDRAIPLCRRGGCEIDRCEIGFVDRDGADANGCECPLANGGVEACNAVDDDCDGRTDETFNVDNDPQNCGACGRPCMLANATPTCVAGDCRIGACDAGFGDADGLAGTGCECAEANGGAEACNGGDDDCDGQTDEGFNTQTDPLNCGGCGQACDLANASEICVSGGCRIGDCDGGFGDADGLPGNGCECAERNGGVEACNGFDDDCDGNTDEGVRNACGACGPVPAEVCNEDDDDCDGNTDEGFNTQTDPLNCGGCGQACELDNATPICVSGGCRIGACDDGFGDADELDGNGCECAEQNGGVEACNGGDDDCDGATDETFDLQNDAANCGACGTVCDLDNATSVCQGGDCTIGPCDDGWENADGNPATGCEAPVNNCPVQQAAPSGCYPITPTVNYQCGEILVLVSFSISEFQFVYGGGNLTVSGAPIQMTDAGVAEGGPFDATGSIPSQGFGCSEYYQLTGDFDDADTWTGTLSLTFDPFEQFLGLPCDQVCPPGSWAISGTRQ
ncbi:MAG: MopE-related protein [Planctomycetota bacterium]|jgi:hypothetical protein